MGRRIARQIVRSAGARARTHNLFRLSPLFGLQTIENIPDTVSAVTTLLSRLGMSGYILQEMTDQGNGRQVYGLPRAMITERSGKRIPGQEIGKDMARVAYFEASLSDDA